MLPSFLQTVPVPRFTRRVLLAAIATFSGLCVLPAAAQGNYPDRPIKLVVGYPPGGSADVTGRIVADMLTQRLGVSVVVENIGGAGGSIGAQRVVASAPDGYTLMAGSNNEIAILNLTNPSLKYSGIRDMTLVGLINKQPFVVVATPKSKVKNLDEFVAAVKANPGKLSYGTSGLGTTFHLVGELIQQKAGVSMLHVPYRGAGALATDLLGGQIEYGVMTLSAALPNIRNGRLLALGTTDASRAPSTPDVAAFSEHKAFAGFEMGNWYLLAGPKGLPAEVVKRLQAALRDGLADPAIRKRLEDSGSQPFTGKEDVDAFVASESRKYKEIVDFAKISVKE